MRIKNIFLLSTLFISIFVFGQPEKQKIIVAFDKVDFRPDSTIKAVFKMKEGQLEGYSIEFDTIGEPNVIGKYKNGKKDGKWLYKTGNFASYKFGELESVATPGCGTGGRVLQNDFKNLYCSLCKLNECITARDTSMSYKSFKKTYWDSITMEYKENKYIRNKICEAKYHMYVKEYYAAIEKLKEINYKTNLDSTQLNILKLITKNFADLGDAKNAEVWQKKADLFQQKKTQTTK